ncbi:hypothetical protein GCM10009526_00120 [Glutamicibacter creatinolyticus]
MYAGDLSAFLRSGDHTVQLLVRAGVVLTDLRPAGQAETLPGLGPPGEGRNLGPTLDAVAARFGVGSIGLGYGGLGTPPS